jgi:hypothetical protein
MTICSGSAAGEVVAADGEDAAGGVKGSGPPATARASPFGSDLEANGSAPFPEPGSAFAACPDPAVGVDGD